MVQSFRDLIVWQRSMDLVVEIQRISRGFPKDEKYMLVQQIRRASLSIALNIAEGHSRSSQRDYARFIEIARGSLADTSARLSGFEERSR